MSTYLELCVDARRECGISGSGPTAVTNQTGELARLVEWVAQAYTEIQARKSNWRWLRSSFTVNTTASDDTYAYGDCTDTGTSSAISRFRRWYPTEFKIYLTSAGVGTQRWLPYQPWDLFKRTYRIATVSNAAPQVVTIDPANQIVLGPTPEAIYTLTGDYQKSAQVIAADGDTPEMPADFHQLIVYAAMRKYAQFHGAPEVYAAAAEEHRMLWADLCLDQLEPANFGNPLA